MDKFNDEGCSHAVRDESTREISREQYNQFNDKQFLQGFIYAAVDDVLARLLFAIVQKRGLA
jgi:hypothetical protein